MKFTKGAVAALQLSSLADAAGTAGGPSPVSWSVLLYKGAVPTFAEFNTAMNSPNFLNTSTTNREPYQNYQDLLVARDSDYLGGVSGRSVPQGMAQGVGKIELLLNNASAGNIAIVSGQTSRLTVINQDGTPTWFALVIATSSVIAQGTSSPMVGNASNIVFGCLGTVGDETSTADLRILGGKVYSNAANQNDQSKALNISNLILTFN